MKKINNELINPQFSVIPTTENLIDISLQSIIIPTTLSNIIHNHDITKFLKKNIPSVITEVLILKSNYTKYSTIEVIQAYGLAFIFIPFNYKTEEKFFQYLDNNLKLIKKIVQDYNIQTLGISDILNNNNYDKNLVLIKIEKYLSSYKPLTIYINI